jgi:hypothetical protein
MSDYHNLRLQLASVPEKRITRDSLMDFIHDEDTKRINFASTHASSLHKDENGMGWINLPFTETFEYFARKELELSRVLFRRSNGKGYYRRIAENEEYSKCESFWSKYWNLVFLKDCLDLSVALSMHETMEEERPKRTELGQHEYNLKYHSGHMDTSVDSQYIVKLLQHWLNELPYYNWADYICAVPSRHPFMKGLIKNLTDFDFVDISDCLSWQNKVGDVKNQTSAEAKLNLIDSWGLRIDEALNLKDSTVLLVDDMYRSGVTMQYIAMKLKEHGVKRVFGLALCKALGND